MMWRFAELSEIDAGELLASERFRSRVFGLEPLGMFGQAQADILYILHPFVMTNVQKRCAVLILLLASLACRVRCKP